MPKSTNFVLAFAFCGTLLITPTHAQDTSDRALLSTFCDAGNIHGKTCTRAKDYPNAPKRGGCDVTLTGDPYRGRFVASRHPLMVVLYESGCEAHATDNGGSVVFEQAGGAWVFKGFEPGMQAGSCVTIAKDDRQDLLVCLNGHMGQGIMETGVALMMFTTSAKGIGLSVDMLLRAEESSGAFGANTVTCKERPPRYFELDKLKAGPRPMTVSLDASWADAETFRTACGNGFPKPPEAIGELVPGDAWVPDDRIKRGTVVIDLATRKAGTQ